MDDPVDSQGDDRLPISIPDPGRVLSSRDVTAVQEFISVALMPTALREAPKSLRFPARISLRQPVSGRKIG